MKLSSLMVYLFEECTPPTPTKEPALEEGLEEVAAYPEGFDIKTLKSLPSFAQKKKYVMKYLPKLGAGSARVVFAADPGIVLKVAKNAKGIAQNEVEFDVSQYAEEYGFENLIARVVDSDPDNIWLESERARKSTAEDWRRIYGVPKRDAMMLIYKTTWTHDPARREAELADKSPEFKEMIQDIKNFVSVNRMEIGDLSRTSSWGVVTRGGKDHLVLVDYGYSTEVRNKHYTPKNLPRQWG